MEKRYELMIGNRILGISRLMRDGKIEEAQTQYDKLFQNFDPVILERHTKTIEAVKKWYQAGDTEMLDIIGNGVIDSLVG